MTLFFCFSEPYIPQNLTGLTMGIVKGETAPMDVVRIETKTSVSIHENAVYVTWYGTRPPWGCVTLQYSIDYVRHNKQQVALRIQLAPR